MTSSLRFHRDILSRFPVWTPLVTLAGLLLVVPTVSHACSVPVFRYALEHWQADPYVAVVFHRGELSPEQRSLVDRLDPKPEAGRSITNVMVRTVDLDTESSEAILELWKQHETEALPLVSLQSTQKLGPPQTIWSGELSAETVAALITSPVRSQLRDRLIAGDSVVWVFLESGVKESDDAAFSLLEQELARLQNVIELPAIEEQDLAELTLDPEELKIAFSALRVSRDDQQERLLIEMLLRVEPDLLEEPYVKQAMAFPIFGRGRALYALVGDGITAETIEDASRFLTGACQCTVKAQNPGVDLLMSVDWDLHVTPALPYDDSQPTLTGLTSLAAAMQADTESEGAPSAVSKSPTPPDDAAQAAATTEDAPLQTGEDAPLLTSEDAPLLNPADWQQAMTAPATPAPPPEGIGSITRSITFTLGLMVAGVVLVTLVILLKSRSS